MAITVHYFARLREDLGRTEDRVPDGLAPVMARDLWWHLQGEEPPPRLMLAINHAHARLDAWVQEGDEVAFFPPVTGG